MTYIFNARFCYLFIALYFVTASFLKAQPPAFGRPERVKYKSLFNDEAAGTIAFLPGLGNERYLSRVNVFDLMRTSGFYELPAKGHYYFQVQNVTPESRVIFLECAIYTVFRKGEALKDPIRLFRSAGEWEGRKYADGTVRNVSYKGLTLTVSSTLEAFSQTHKGDNIKAVDEMMGSRAWHAWPTADPDSQGSWDFKKDLADGPPARFDELIRACNLPDRTATDICLTVHLIRFTTPTEPDSTRPLYFSFNADNAVGAYMHLRSPLFAYGTQDYYFKFADNLGNVTR
jgi:hypothetical protein